MYLPISHQNDSSFMTWDSREAWNDAILIDCVSEEIICCQRTTFFPVRFCVSCPCVEFVIACCTKFIKRHSRYTVYITYTIALNGSHVLIGVLMCKHLVADLYIFYAHIAFVGKNKSITSEAWKTIRPQIRIVKLLNLWNITIVACVSIYRIVSRYSVLVYLGYTDYLVRLPEP